jgi:outer membrane protein assembly factor BamD (BamD/ComL family)
MTALASGQYAKASEMLKAIETQYPDSELLSKVAEIQSRLKGAAKESDPPGSTNQ